MIKIMYVLLGFSLASIFLFYNRNKIKAFYQRKKSQVNMMLSIVKLLTANVNNNKCPDLLVNERGNSANIVYTYGGKEFNINVPFNRSYILNTMDIKAILKCQDGRKIDITQQAGIPYLITAEELGGCEIVLINENTGKEYIYREELPMYGKEVWEEE